jgi:hypothetical protein
MVGLGKHGILMNDPVTGILEHPWGGEYLPVGIDTFLANDVDLATWSSGSGIEDRAPVLLRATVATIDTGRGGKTSNAGCLPASAASDVGIANTSPGAFWTSQLQFGAAVFSGSRIQVQRVRR